MNTISQIFPKTGRISGPEVGDGAKPDVPTTDRQNEKKKKHRPFYEAVDARARRRLKSLRTLGLRLGVILKNPVETPQVPIHKKINYLKI